MNRVAVAALQKNFRVHAAFHHVRRSPLAGDHGVVAQVPPKVVRQILRPAFDFPFPQNLKALRVHNKNPARPISRGRPQRAAKNPLGTAMNRVWPAVSCTLRQHLGFNHLDEFRFPRVRFRINDVDPRRLNPRHDQVPPLRVRMRHVRAQASAAGVPAEMVQFISGVGHLQAPNHSAISARRRVHIHHTQRVGSSVAFRIQHRHVGQLLRRRSHRHSRRWVKRRVRSPKFQVRAPLSQ